MPVEPATLDDLDRIVDCWVALAAEQRDHGAHLTPDGNRELMREALAQHVIDHTCLVARAESGESSGRAGVIGFVSFDLERDGLDRDVTRGVVHNLYVVPEARDRGIGRRLLTAAEEALAAGGAERVVLEVLARNEAARRFYETGGYEPHRVTYERPAKSDTNSREGT